MSTLTLPQFPSRARSSSTVGPITTARSRTVSHTKSAGPTTVDESEAASPPAISPSPLASETQAGMLDTLVQIASKLIPFHDALSSPSSLSYPPEKSKDEVQLAFGQIVSINEKSVRWDDRVSVKAAADAPSETRRAGRTRPPSKKRHRRPLSPFSSLFITPPSSVLPPPVSSPRTSGSFSRLLSVSISISDSSSPSATLPPPRLLTPLLYVCSLFFITFIPTLVLFYTLPIPSLKSVPRTLQDIRDVARELQVYAASSHTGTAHIFAVLAVTSVWKNAWSVPGSVLLNVLAGALMNPILATLLQTILTTIGSICSSLLSKPLAPVISRVFPKALSLTRSAFESPVSSPELSPVDSEDEDAHGYAMGEKRKTSTGSAPTPVWVRLTILRLVGVVPWSALNLACGICDVPLWDCLLGSFIGVLPWTAVTCQIGDLLQTVAAKTTAAAGSSAPAPAETLSALLSSPSIIAKLIVLSLISLGPVLLRDKLSDVVARRVSSGRKNSEMDGEDHFVNEKA